MGFGFWTLALEGPDFLSKILPLGSQISSNGFYSALPFLIFFILAPVIGTLADYAINRNAISPLNSQRLCMILTCLIPAAGLLGITYLTEEATQFYGITLGWKLMSCSRCQELCQQASWLLIGYTRVNSLYEVRSAS